MQSACECHARIRTAWHTHTPEVQRGLRNKEKRARRERFALRSTANHPRYDSWLRESSTRICHGQINNRRQNRMCTERERANGRGLFTAIATCRALYVSFDLHTHTYTCLKRSVFMSQHARTLVPYLYRSTPAHLDCPPPQVSATKKLI